MIGKQDRPLPIFRSDRFEFGEREIPDHVDRDPTEEDIDATWWAVDGVAAVGSEERVLLAANVSGIGDEIGEDGRPKKGPKGEDVAAMLRSARLGYLSRTQPDAGLFDGNEASPVIPHARLQPMYEEGARKAEATRAEIAAARANPQPIGQAANRGADARIEPIPLPVPA